MGRAPTPPIAGGHRPLAGGLHSQQLDRVVGGADVHGTSPQGDDAGIEPLTIARPSATGEHVRELWAAALREVCDAADATPQERVRVRAAVRELRSYARLD